MSRLLKVPESIRIAHESVWFEDHFVGFLTATSTDKYTVVTAVDGTVLQIDSAPGGVAIKSAVASASGNEDCYLVREAEAFKLADDKPLYFKAIVQATEDDVNQNNLFVGLTDGAAANLLVDNGAGPKTSGNTLCFFKVDGGLNWHVYGRDDADSDVFSVELTAANSLDKKAHIGSGANKQMLEIEFLPKSSTLADVVFYIDGVEVYKRTDWRYSGSATDIQAVVGCKDGDAGDEVTINCYYLACCQAR